MSTNKKNWYKIAMPLLDESGPDGSIFGSGTFAPDPNAPYAPNKADFVEAPFLWLQNIDGGELRKRMEVVLQSLIKRFPHIPAASIAHSVNNGVTMYLNANCHDGNFLDGLGFDCKSIIDQSPSRDQIENSRFEPDEVAIIVYDKMSNYFKHN